MSDPRLDPASLAWGLSLGITFGMWLRGTLDALFLRPRRTSISDADWPLDEPPRKFRCRTDKPQFPPPRITGP
jgi:hypothetical protein